MTGRHHGNVPRCLQACKWRQTLTSLPCRPIFQDERRRDRDLPPTRPRRRQKRTLCFVPPRLICRSVCKPDADFRFLSATSGWQYPGVLLPSVALVLQTSWQICVVGVSQKHAHCLFWRVFFSVAVKALMHACARTVRGNKTQAFLHPRYFRSRGCLHPRMFSRLMYSTRNARGAKIDHPPILSS